MRSSPEWERGDRTQRAWADELARCGRCVLPTHAFDEVVEETRAPMMVVPRAHSASGLLITPDVLTLMPGKRMAWHEVKAKTGPSARRNPPGPRWEHGFDFSLLDEYKAVQQATGIEVFVVVGESVSPADDAEQLSQNIHAICLPPGKWLFLSLTGVEAAGRHEPQWPKRNGRASDLGRDGKGGWLWDRALMRVWKGTAP